jgi:hypothetical protein
MPTKREYLSLIKEGSRKYRETYYQSLEEWRIQMESAEKYYPPVAPLHYALIEGFLYSISNNMDHAKQARDALLVYAELPEKAPNRLKSLSIYSKGIFPTVPRVHLFLHAYEFIKDSRLVKNKDRETIERIIENTLEPYFLFPEWGPHNRASTSGVALFYAAKVFPDNPKAPKWMKLGNLLIEGCMGHWSLEDSTNYNAIWLEDLVTYADLKEDLSIYNLPMVRYYFDYLRKLLCPLGMVPDFGDSIWGYGWDLCLILMEKGATVYRDPYMKYAANKIFTQFGQMEKLMHHGRASYVFAYLWADDTIEAKIPNTYSQEVLDETIGKKIVFRSGWDENATYLLLNYRDEGDIGWYYKEHLRNTLVVTAEKMHHGHADENSIVALIKDGSFLLHDSGYREGMPNGAYRADVYHNRIIVREGRPIDQSLFDFMFNATKGIYQPTRSRRVFFKTFRDIDVSRTDIMDEKNGYYWDRVVTYLKVLEAFIIQDGIRILRNGEFTVGNLFWTQQIHESGVNYFDTSIDLIGLVGAWNRPTITLEERRQNAFPNKGGVRLLIYYCPDSDKIIGVDEVMRCYLPEKCVYQFCSKSFKKGDIISFTTILWPHKADETIDKILEGVKIVDVDKYPSATAIQLNLPVGKISICTKHDLSIGLVRPSTRPVYTYDDGKVRYGELTTDAAYAYTKLFNGTLSYAFIDGMKLFYRENEVFSSERPSVYNLDHRLDISRRGVLKTKREYWTYELKTKWESWEDDFSFE